MHTVAGLVVFLLLVLLPGSGNAQSARTGDRLVMAVVVSRHGLRSPLVPNATLNRYSAEGWPVWPVAPGVLTTRGARQLQLLGAYDGALLRSQGLLSGSSCQAARAAWVWTDTDQRTRASGQALAEGMFPGCPVTTHHRPPHTYDPLFNLTHAAVSPQLAAAAVEQVRQCAQGTPELDQRMQELASLLANCSPGSASCAGRPALALLHSPASVEPSPHGIVDWQGPLPLASSFAEDFELEYLENMPMRSVAWGRLTPVRLNALIALHTRYIACLDDTPALAQLGASDLLAHIVATLQQGVQQSAVAGALASPEKKLVLVVGHDSNLVGLASLLGLHWGLDGRKNDTPPASAMVFEVWSAADGQDFVRIAMQMPSLAELRALSPLTLRHPPLMQQVGPPGCQVARGCPWSRFQAAAMHALDSRFVQVAAY